ncbi:hypothetical protein H0H92_008335 [Tricholoma furcatifolium]|nr:hypothetical protein H0H92_008335 [Tricholoma furcatifolium]
MDGSHLSVVLDLSPTQWNLSPLPLNIFLAQLLAFLNAHIASKHENTLAVFGAFPGKSVTLYSSTDPAQNKVPIDANSYPPFRSVDSTIVTRIMEEFDEQGQPNEEGACVILPSFRLATDMPPFSTELSNVNRITLPTPANSKHPDALLPAILPDPRILILSVSPDLSTSYIPIMNSIFSAQKLASCFPSDHETLISHPPFQKLTIDVCQIYGPDSVFLQQAAHLTGGSYIFLERRDALLQYLMMSFLSPPSIRKVLSVPTQDKIDFRAACFCHKTIVDIGTKFPMKTLQRLNAARPLLPSGNSTPSRASSATPQARPSATPGLNGSSAETPNRNGTPRAAPAPPQNGSSG